MSEFSITSYTDKTVSEIILQWALPATKVYSNIGYVECLFTIRNLYHNPGRLSSLKYSLDGGVTKQTATVVQDGIGVDSVDLNSLKKQVSVWWYAGYDLRIMQKFENVKLYAIFCEDITDTQTEELETTLDIDFRPTGLLRFITPLENTKSFNLKFVSMPTKEPGSLHFKVEVDKVDTFNSEDLIVLSSKDSPLDWLSNDETFPAAGVVSSQDRTIQYIGTQLISLALDKYYYRVTAEFDQFYPEISLPLENHVSTYGESIDIIGNIVVMDEYYDAIQLTCGAGRFNFSWDNPNARLWRFPDGTVLYSDGVTPVNVSTDQQPDVVIPAGGGIVTLECFSFYGNYSLKDNNTNTVLQSALSDFQGLTFYLSLSGCSNVSGALSDLPDLTYYLDLAYCAAITGSLADLPPLRYSLSLYGCVNITGSLTDLPPLRRTLNLGNCAAITGSLANIPRINNYLNLYGCSNVTGSLADLPPLTYYLDLAYCSAITGTLADLPPVSYYLSLYNCVNITGSLADLPPLTYYLNLSNCGNVSGVYSAVSGTNVPNLTYIDNTDMSASDMDNTLIAYAATTKSNGTFRANGMTRTADSDTAVSTLLARGWTVSGITKV